MAALRAGDAGDAERLLRGHLRDYPFDAAALTKLAEIVVANYAVEEATTLLRRAAVADPDIARRLTLIIHLHRYVGADPTLQAIAHLPAGQRHHPTVLAIEAACHGSLGDHARQIDLYGELLEASANDPFLWKALADALHAAGRSDDAEAALHKALAIRPNWGEAWWALSNLGTYVFDDRDLASMRKLLRGRLGDDDALHLHFALGSALEQRAEFAGSFRHYEAGNSLRRRGLDPTAFRVTEFIDRSIETYSREMFARHGSGCDTTGPIFVLGMHRSGSTLVEQILASHPLIEGTSELPVLQYLWERFTRLAALRGRSPFEELAALDDEAIRSIGEEYIERTRAFRLTDRPFFIDKLPANWVHAGLIRLALPNARIIETRRHPMACGFSNFKQNYASGIRFSYSLESIGHFYRDYVRFMDHIDAVQPDTIHRVINERLIEDPEGEIRAMLDFIGVAFDPSCMEFHRNERAVRTPSAAKVRRPINRDGIDHWRNYEPWLGPLKTALGPVLETWDHARSARRAAEVA